jgi:D-methionine transport system substrate-binding protein
VLLEAAQLPRSREDVDFSVINGNFAASSGIPFNSGLFLERSYDFINWVVVKSADADKPFAKDVAEAYNSAAFKAYAAKRFVGYKYPEGGRERVPATERPASQT